FVYQPPVGGFMKSKLRSAGAKTCARAASGHAAAAPPSSVMNSRHLVGAGAPKPQHPLSAMSYCHMSFDWCSEAIANAVGGKCISYVGGNLCLCLLIQASNCCCDRGC